MSKAKKWVSRPDCEPPHGVHEKLKQFDRTTRKGSFYTMESIK